VARALDLPPTAVLDSLAEFRRRYRLLPTPPASLFPGAAATLAALHGAGWRLAVCSNKPEVLCRKALQDLGLDHYFGSVVGGDTAPFPKPHAAPVQHALAELQVAAPRALLVGDSTVDQQAAAAAGVPFIFFTGGYDDGVAAGTPRASIDRLGQLPDLLAHLLTEPPP
jgi:phosphoglycolate phosphatase